jgi:hypothetical protein
MLGAAAPAFAQYRQSLSGQRVQSVLGSRVRLERRDGSRLSGELLAAERDSVWVLDRGEIAVMPLVLLQSVQVRRGGGPDATGILVWAVVGGLVTGGALTAACSSVTEDCGGVFVGTLVSWGLVGGIAAAITRSPHRWLPLDAHAIAPYARFPQGLPPSVTPNMRRAPSPSPP